MHSYCSSNINMIINMIRRINNTFCWTHSITYYNNNNNINLYQKKNKTRGLEALTRMLFSGHRWFVCEEWGPVYVTK